ncbi:hypothetical protein RGQ21_78540 [Kitasatospora aureofaciens]|nr:hypothetical protein RGQ21_78540 [Kitasatospora aureofaciens]
MRRDQQHPVLQRQAPWPASAAFAGHLVEDPVEAAAQAGCCGGRRTDVSDWWKCLQEQGLSCRVEVDMPAEDDVVGVDQVGSGIAERGVADWHLDIAGRPVSRAALELQP